MRCAEHDDRTASAQINYTTGRWCCFGCDLNEDVIEMVMRHESVGYKQALEICEQITGQQDAKPTSGRRRRPEPMDGQGELMSRRRRR